VANAALLCEELGIPKDTIDYYQTPLTAPPHCRGMSQTSLAALRTVSLPCQAAKGTGFFVRWRHCRELRPCGSSRFSFGKRCPEETYYVQMSPLVEFRGDILIPGSVSFPGPSRCLLCSVFALSLPSTSLIFMRSFSPTNRLVSRATPQAPKNSSRRDAAPAAKVMDGCVGWAEQQHSKVRG
jgi:hypothetical protein